jgi:HupE / UreJ protein
MIFKIYFTNRQNKIWRLVFFIIFTFSTKLVSAHLTPTTNVLLNVSPNLVAVELQLPIQELELSFGNNLSQNPNKILTKYEPQLREYLLAHIHTYVNKENPWTIEVVDMNLNKTFDAVNNQPIWELIVHLNLIPNIKENTRNFIFDYDVILHEVVNHIAYVSIKSDWENGLINNQASEIRTISRDMSSNTILPLKINLQGGNKWKGFKSMFSFGMLHIKEGTDHLLFIITLLLPACLLTSNKKWTIFGGTKYSLKRLIKIITAFTIGHSITLLFGAFGILKIPTQFIEIAIAISILFSAIHAIRPFFYGKEIYVAIGFGLIHGLAFSQTLTALHLNSTNLVISILGFNVGIEAMQLFIVAFIIPWFILLAQTNYFKFIRIPFAILVAIAAIGWILQRITNQNNFITNSVDKSLLFSHWIIVGLAIFSATIFILTKKDRTTLQNKTL